MKQDLNCRFYSVFKGGDAEPYTADGLLAAAGGLSGADNTAPVTDDGFYRREKRDGTDAGILRRALPEFDESKQKWLKPYIDCWLASMAGGRFGVPTLPQAPIMLLRFVFALRELDGYLENLDNAEARESLLEFISADLTDSADTSPDLSNGGQKLPAPSLAAAAYHADGGGVRAEVVWTGNARIYAWTKGGLLLLSAEESEDAALFGLPVSGIGQTKLNYRRHDLLLPCVLVAATDGVFRSYDTNGLLALLTGALKDADSPAAFAEALQSHYDETKFDDASGGFVPVGFSSFEKMKEELVPKTRRQELNRIAMFVSDPLNCSLLLSEVLAAEPPVRAGPPLVRAFTELRQAAASLLAARSVFDGHLRVQSGIMEVERGFVETVSKRRKDIRKECERIAREKAENSENQKNIYHVKMTHLEEKIHFLQKELKKLCERYRKSCNPRGCPVCGPRCMRYLSLPGPVTAEIKERTKEQRVCILEYNALKDKYLTLHSDLSRLDNKEQELEREDYELQRFLQDYEAGITIVPEQFRSGSAQVFAERIHTLGDRAAVSQNITEAEKIVAEKTAQYETAVELFFACEHEILNNLTELFYLDFFNR